MRKLDTVACCPDEGCSLLLQAEQIPTFSSKDFCFATCTKCTGAFLGFIPDSVPSPFLAFLVHVLLNESFPMVIACDLGGPSVRELMVHFCSHWIFKNIFSLFCMTFHSLYYLFNCASIAPTLAYIDDELTWFSGWISTKYWNTQ